MTLASSPCKHCVFGPRSRGQSNRLVSFPVQARRDIRITPLPCPNSAPPTAWASEVVDVACVLLLVLYMEEHIYTTHTVMDLWCIITQWTRYTVMDLWCIITQWHSDGPVVYNHTWTIDALVVAVLWRTYITMTLKPQWLICSLYTASMFTYNFYYQ